jgi:hypothetical protein
MTDQQTSPAPGPAYPWDPECVAQHLDAAGQTAAATLVRALTGELAAVRRERDGLAAFTRLIAGLNGSDMSHNCTLIVRAREALDGLRVTRRCAKHEDGRHRPHQYFGGLIRCLWCHARLPYGNRT